MKTLIVKDDFTSCNLLAGVLEKEGHEVMATANVAEAWRALQPGDTPALEAGANDCLCGGEWHDIQV